MNESVINNNIIVDNFVFTMVDYSVLIFMLAISTAIGIYFGCFSPNAQSTEEYLLGGRKMKVIPIAISLVASQLSGITIMAVPAEIYAFGSQYWIIVISMFTSVFAITYVFVPVFYNNHISNCYEYLEMRFGRFLRQLITACFVISIYMALPVVVFVPALAFSQLTNINIHLINACVCTVCVIYTMLGGIKAVVWTDVVQACIMLGSCLMVVVFGVQKVGGLSRVWSLAEEGNHVNFFNMKLDLTTRQTFWNALLGYITIITAHTGFSQSCVQRIVSVPSLNHARRALWIFSVGFMGITSLNCFTGVVMYARYADCDPVKAGIVQKPDKMVPFFVQDTIGHLNGMTGLFISCVFSAALSTMSAYMNALAGITYEDYVRPLKLFKHSEASANLAMKTLVCLTGIYCVLGGFVVEQFAHILQIIFSISGMSQGAIMGAFCLGMLWPWANKKGVITGVLASIFIMAWITIGQQVIINRGELSYTRLPSSVEGCNARGLNISISNDQLSPIPYSNHTVDDSFSIYKISFPWFGVIGTMIVFIVAIPVSYFTGGEDVKRLGPRLIAPICHWMLPKEAFKNEQSLGILPEITLTKDYENVEKKEWIWVPTDDPDTQHSNGNNMNQTVEKNK